MDPPQTDTPTKSVDAFILFNEEEESVAKIVDELSSLGISTYFWRRDISFGARWENIESDKLRAALAVVVFLGRRGWGPTHLKLTKEAQSLNKDIIPVLIESPTNDAWDEADGLFRKLRYVDLARSNSVAELAQEIRRRREALGNKDSRTPRRKVNAQIEIPDLIKKLLAYPLLGPELVPPIRRATKLAHEILGRAALVNPAKGVAEISTTRLLIGAFIVGCAIEHSKASINDRSCVLALSRVLKTNKKFAKFHEIQSQYVKELQSDVTIESVTVSGNVEEILAKASLTGALTADSLVAALLTHPNTHIETRLRDAGISLSALRSEVLAELCVLEPSRIDYWRRLFEATEPDPEAVTSITVARIGNDNPDRENLDDKLGISDEARAFARVAAAKQVHPPLAFGIFGDWGSGKSFFMRLMQEYVDKLAPKNAEEARTGLFLENIVQIRFNAWHYAETNLWASLVDHIFSELDRWVLKSLNETGQNTLFDRLTTARDLTLESAERLVRRRKEQKAAAERLASAERELAAANEKIGVTPRLFWKVVRENFASSVSQKDIEKASATLGLDQLACDAELLKKTIDSLAIEGQRAKIVTQGIWHRLCIAPSLIFILLAIIVVPPTLAWLLEGLKKIVTSPGHLQAFLTHINSTVLATAGILASAAGLVSVVTRHVASAITKLEGFRGELDRVIAEQVKTPTEEVKSAQGNLAKLTGDVAEARVLLANTSDHLAEAAREYASGTGRGRLLRFVRERASEGQYAKHLGLIATVRKDFTDLSAMISNVDKGVQDESTLQIDSYRKRVGGLIELADKENLLTSDDKEQLGRSFNTVPDDSKPKRIFQRIVLYIDDLDRCSPPKVVDVLQAVHLLLTFPLFVVVVAVDARWISRSLETQYEHLLGQEESAVTSPGATARDYLEKIFQVPYWVRPMTAKGSRDLLMGLAALPSTDMMTNDVTLADKTVRPNESSTVVSTTEGEGDGAIASEKDTPPIFEENQTQDPQPKLIEGPPVSGAGNTTARIAARALEFTEGEQAFMKHLAPFLGSTPRRALRFLNVYRVIKASLGAEELLKLEKGGGYRGLMTQLAMTTGSSTFQKRWSELLNSAARGDTLKKMESRLKAEPWFQNSPDGRRLHDIISAFWSSRHISDPKEVSGVSETQTAVDRAQTEGVEDLKHYSEIAMRYSFGS